MEMIHEVSYLKQQIDNILWKKPSYTLAYLVFQIHESFLILLGRPKVLLCSVLCRRNKGERSTKRVVQRDQLMEASWKLGRDGWGRRKDEA